MYLDQLDIQGSMFKVQMTTITLKPKAKTHN